jgi:hypothetical protein
MRKSATDLKRPTVADRLTELTTRNYYIIYRLNHIQASTKGGSNKRMRHKQASRDDPTETAARRVIIGRNVEVHVLRELGKPGTKERRFVQWRGGWYQDR